MDVSVAFLLCALTFAAGYLLGHHYGMMNAMEIKRFLDKSNSPRPTQD